MDEEQAARLRSALEHVTKHPREWVQDHYLARNPCGTVACLAGRIVLEAGQRYRDVNWVQVLELDPGSDEFVPIPDVEAATTVRVENGDQAFISQVAAERVGLSYDQAATLFAASNSLRILWQMAAGYSGGLIEVPATLPEWADLSAADANFRSGAPTSHVGAYLDQVERRVR